MARGGQYDRVHNDKNGGPIRGEFCPSIFVMLAVVTIAKQGIQIHDLEHN